MEKINQKELAEIFNRIKNGDEKSYNQFYELYYKLIYGIAFSIIKNKENSEDIAQNVFEKIYKMPKKNLPQNYEASWLYTVTKNETLQFMRKQKNNIDIDDIYKIQQNDENINLLIDTDYYNSLIKKLKPKEQEIVTLKVISNLTFSQIGKMLNMPTGTVQWSYYKSINVLKISISTLAAALLTFTIGLTKITRPKGNLATLPLEEPKSNNVQFDSSSEISQSTKSENTVNTNTTQTIQVEESTVKNTDWQPYTLFGISLTILVTGFIVVKKLKNKIFKKI